MPHRCVLPEHLRSPCATIGVRYSRLLLTHRLAINYALVLERRLVEPRRLAAGVVLDCEEGTLGLFKYLRGGFGVEAKHLKPDVVAFNLDVEINPRQPGQVLRVALEINNSCQIECARVDLFALLDDVVEQPAEQAVLWREWHQSSPKFFSAAAGVAISRRRTRSEIPSGSITSKGIALVPSASQTRAASSVSIFTREKASLLMAMCS